MKSILVIRRDNIGDLVCTTPVIHALRERYPNARIDALVNSYNLPVIEHNPDLNNVYAYTKAKHRAANESLFGVIWRRLCLMVRLRTVAYDLIILANGHCLKRPLRLARIIGARHVLGFYSPKVSGAEIIDLRIPVATQRVGHEVEAIFELLSPLDISPPPGPLVLQPDPVYRQKARVLLQQQPWYQTRLTLAIHISARKPSQRWSAASFVEVIKTLAARGDVQFMLFWAPGDEDNPMHPGDNRKAAEIMGALAEGFPLQAWPTQSLQELIGGLAICHGMLCSDGGAMHLGAALGLPTACFFGQSDVTTWHPWRVPHRVMQPESRNVADVSVETVLEELHALWPAMQGRLQALG